MELMEVRLLTIIYVEGVDIGTAGEGFGGEENGGRKEEGGREKEGGWDKEGIWGGGGVGRSRKDICTLPLVTVCNC